MSVSCKSVCLLKQFEDGLRSLLCTMRWRTHLARSHNSYSTGTREMKIHNQTARIAYVGNVTAVIAYKPPR